MPKKHDIIIIYKDIDDHVLVGSWLGLLVFSEVWTFVHLLVGPWLRSSWATVLEGCISGPVSGLK